MLNRRKFLIGASTAAMVAGLSNEARAFFHRAPVSPFNASKVQISPSGTDASAFLNFVSALGSFQASGGTYAYPSVLNADGYPTGTIGATIFGTFPIPSNLTSADTLVFAWTGTITASALSITINSPGATVTVGAASFVNGGTGFGINFKGTNGYVEWNFAGTPPTGNTALNFASGGTFTGFSNLIICRKADYATIIAATNPQQLLSQNYVNVYKTLNPKTIRAMPWTNPNNNIFTQHRYRKNWQTALSYSTPEWAPSCWAGGSGTAGPNITSGGVGNAFVAAAATDTPAAYTMGEVIQGQMDAAGSGTGLTINVGGRGVVPLFNSSGGTLTASAITANANATLIYDDLLGGYIYSGSGMSANIPVEMQIALANAVGCNLWYNFPPHITTVNSTMEPTNSVVQIATLIASTLNNGCYFEWANEIWNFGGVVETSWAVACGAALGFPLGNNRQYNGFYAYRLATIFPQVVTAWGAKSGLRCVNAFQGAGVTGVGGSTNVYRLKGADLASIANGGSGNATWISYTGNANFTAFPNRPIDLCDVLSYATYYQGAQCQDIDSHYSNAGGTGLTTGGPASGPGSAISGLTGAATAFPTDPANAIAWLDWDIRQGTNNGSAGGATLAALTANYYPPWETIAQSYDGARPSGKANLTIEHYEGAMQCQAPSTAECTTLGISTTYGGAGGLIDNLLTGYKQSALFEATVIQQFNNFFNTPPVSPSIVNHSATACWFTVTGKTEWSMYVGDIYTTPWQSFNAVAAYD